MCVRDFFSLFCSLPPDIYCVCKLTTTLHDDVRPVLVGWFCFGGRLLLLSAVSAAGGVIEGEQEKKKSGLYFIPNIRLMFYYQFVPAVIDIHFFHNVIIILL